MQTLRSLLASLYAFVGAIALFDELILLRAQQDQSSVLYDFSVLRLISVSLLPLAGFLFLIAAISYWRKWRSARVWCLLVSALNLGVPLLLGYVLWHYTAGSFTSTLAANGLLLGLAAVGVFAFWRWDPVTIAAPSNSAITKAQPGDGTSSLLNWSSSAIGFIAFYGIWTAWLHWAQRVGLPAPSSVWNEFLQLTIAELVVVTLHESGHALCGIALGQKVRAFIAGPFQWQHYAGRWNFQFNPLDLLSTGGATGVVPQRLHEPQGREISMIAAGPAVGFVTGAVALWAVLHATGSPWENRWFFLAMFASLSLLTSVVNLIPLRTATGYSDGARIYQLLRGGVWAEFHESMRTAAATLVSALRPRDYDIDAIDRVIDAGIVTGRQQLLLHLLAHSYYLDHGQPRQAANHLHRAEIVYDAAPDKIPGELLSAFVIRAAIDERDPERARLWWNRLTAKKLRWLSADYWMARAALCWVENNSGEAATALAHAQEYLDRMPQTGTYAFDRECLASLTKTLKVESLQEEPVLVT